MERRIRRCFICLKLLERVVCIKEKMLGVGVEVDFVLYRFVFLFELHIIGFYGFGANEDGGA